jgi:hypothetical protein
MHNRAEHNIAFARAKLESTQVHLKKKNLQALQRLMGSLDNIHLITSTLLVLRLFLQTSVIAGAIHLWSFPDPVPASAGAAGFHTASLTYSPHLLLFSLIAAATWAQGFLEAVHRQSPLLPYSALFFLSASLRTGMHIYASIGSLTHEGRETGRRLQRWSPLGTPQVV